MKVLIIDDESRARNVLSIILKEECKDVVEVLEATNLKDGVTIIKKEHPDVVFLDIEMPKESGLEILNYFKNEPINFQIIFVTAYNEYAIEAFKLSAVDYLLKPVDGEELVKAVEKAKKIVKKHFVEQKIIGLEKAFKQLSHNKVALDLPTGIRFISHDNILYFEAEGVYTKVYLTDGKVELITKGLKHFTHQLRKNNLFYKPHRSYLLNLKFMDEIVKKDGFYVVMQNKKTIPIARNRKEEFLQMIEQFF